MGGPLAEAVEALQVVSELVSHLDSQPRGVLRLVVGCKRTLHSFRRMNCNIPNSDIWKDLRVLIWLPMSPKLTYLFRQHPFRTSELRAFGLE